MKRRSTSVSGGVHLISQTINDFLSQTLGVRVVRARYTDEGSDKWHQQQALKALTAIEESTAQKLSPMLKRACDEYSIGVLGKKEYAPWLYVYSLVKGEFREGWIPDNFFRNVVIERINKSIRACTLFKTFTNTVLKTAYIPDIAYYIDELLYDKSFNVIDIDELKEEIGSSYDELFLKRDDSGRGEGVVKILPGNLTSEIFKQIGNCVVQKSIRQHQFFEEIISGSVATIRITTVKERDGSISPRAAFLRLGRKNTAWVQVDNSVRVAIIDDNGKLDRFGYTQDWRCWLKHPDTDFSFQNNQVPEFRKAVEICRKLHSQVPQLTIVGWDVAINSNSDVEIIEWNGDFCDIKFSEATTGPCFLGLNWEQFAKTYTNPQIG